jgi:ABC-2 type transport system ATP-binding protein
MSSHLLADLERVCDHVIVLAAGKTQLCDDIDTVLDEHKLLVGPRSNRETLGNHITVIHETHTTKQSTLLVRISKGVKLPSQWQQNEPNIEEIILAYMGQAKEGGAA